MLKRVVEATNDIAHGRADADDGRAPHGDDHRAARRRHPRGRTPRRRPRRRRPAAADAAPTRLDRRAAAAGARAAAPRRADAAVAAAGEAAAARRSAAPESRSVQQATETEKGISHAEDEDPLGRQEALQGDRQGSRQAQAGAQEPPPQPRVDQAQAPACAAPRSSTRRRRSRSRASCPTSSSVLGKRPLLLGEGRKSGGVRAVPIARSRRARDGPEQNEDSRRVVAATAFAQHAKGFRGGRSKLWKAMVDAVHHAWRFATQHRRKRKRDFRALWIVRINAAARTHGHQLLEAHRRAQARATSSSTARSSPTSRSAIRPRSRRSSSSAQAGRLAMEGDFHGIADL